LERASGKQSYK